MDDGVWSGQRGAAQLIFAMRPVYLYAISVRCILDEYATCVGVLDLCIRSDSQETYVADALIFGDRAVSNPPQGSVSHVAHLARSSLYMAEVACSTYSVICSVLGRFARDEVGIRQYRILLLRSYTSSCSCENMTQRNAHQSSGK